MTPEQQLEFINIINEDRENLKQMIDRIYENIAQYPVYTQLEFTKPIKHMIIEAFFDASNPEDPFLNNHDGGDKIEIDGK